MVVSFKAHAMEKIENAPLATNYPLRNASTIGREAYSKSSSTKEAPELIGLILVAIIRGVLYQLNQWFIMQASPTLLGRLQLHYSFLILC